MFLLLSNLLGNVSRYIGLKQIMKCATYYVNIHFHIYYVNIHIRLLCEM